MGEVGEIYNGLTAKTKKDFGQGRPYIQYKQVFDNSKIDTSRFEFVEIEKNESKNKVKYGDVLFTTSSETPDEVGMSSVLLEDVEDLYLNSFCFGYRPNSHKTLNPEFAQFLFRSEDVRNQIMKLAQGSTRYNMSKIQLMKLAIRLPLLEEQIKIATFFSDVDEKINTNENIHSLLMKQKQWLLANLFI